MARRDDKPSAPRGKRRFHKRPMPGEIVACMPWWRMEIELVRLEMIVCLGATAFERFVAGLSLIDRAGAEQPR